MSSSGSDGKVCVGNRTCWMLTLLTASLIVNVIFAAIGYVALRNVQNNNIAMQNDIASLQEHLLAASDMKHEIRDLLAKNAIDRDKRSVLSATSSSRLVVDVGSVFLTAIKRICKPEGAVCIPGAKGEAGHPGLPGRDGLPGATGRDGPVGLRGPPGAPGAKGKGLPGKQGPIGIPGMKGDKGGRGERGVKGHIGGQGIQGIKGIEGEKGERGNRGEQGYTGDKGEKGERGMAGEKGMRGEKGEKGESGLLLPSQCNETNYRVLSDYWRKTSVSTNHHRDKEGHGGFQPGWHVFADNIGGQMLQTCPPKRSCGTGAAGWLNGTHPTLIGQTRNETVCFRWDSCCQWQVTVAITNCGLFYVYNLPNEPCDVGLCNLAYCGNA